MELINRYTIQPKIREDKFELTFGVTKDDGSKLTLSEKALNYGVSALIICWFIYHATHVL